jgi:hypothetical protein
MLSVATVMMAVVIMIAVTKTVMIAMMRVVVTTERVMKIVARMRVALPPRLRPGC